MKPAPKCPNRPNMPIQFSWAPACWNLDFTAKLKNICCWFARCQVCRSAPWSFDENPWVKRAAGVPSQKMSRTELACCHGSIGRIGTRAFAPEPQPRKSVIVTTHQRLLLMHRWMNKPTLWRWHPGEINRMLNIICHDPWVKWNIQAAIKAFCFLKVLFVHFAG